MGQQPSSLSHVSSTIDYQKDPYFKALVNLYASKSITPLLLKYVRDRHKNVCKSSLYETMLKDLPVDSFLYFSVGPGFPDDVRGKEAETLQHMKNDGFYIAYPSEADIIKYGFGGALLVKQNFIESFVDCIMECSQLQEQKQACFYFFDTTIAIPFGDKHATVLLYNNLSKRFEFYDPEGQDSWSFGRDDPKLQYEIGSNIERFNTAVTVTLRNLNKALEEKGFKGFIDTNKPLETIEETCPRFGAQSLEDKYSILFRTRFPEAAKIGGYCQMWSIMILDARLSNPEKTPLEVSKTLLIAPPGIETGPYLRQKVHAFLMDAYNFMSK